MAGQRLHALGVHVVAQKLQRASEELTLSWVDDQAVLLQAVEQLLQVHGVLLRAAAEDDDVIQVDKGVWQVAQDSVHQPLECLCGIP